MNLLRSLLIATSAAAIASAAHATVINFDDLGNLAPIANGYQGLNWNNIYSVDGVDYGASGYQNGVVSPKNVAYNAYGDPGSISVAAGTFTFNGADFTAAWMNGLQLTLTGLAGGSTLYSTVLTLDTSGPLHFTTNWSGIDTLTFSTAGGTRGPYDGGGEHFAMDNLTINAAGGVPEPATWAMMIAGFGLAGATLRRRRVALAA